MSESDWLTESFERNRPRLRAVAYRMLGSLAEADDAVQEAWLRASRSDPEPDQLHNLDGWLTTIVARICLNILRARRRRPEEPAGLHVPDPVVTAVDAVGPEDEALLADAVGLALQVVLGTLAPAERLAFVLHDMFDLPFDEIARVTGRTPAAARQLASRARRRVRGAESEAPEPDVAVQRQAVDAFYAAARRGDLDGLVALLDPDVVLRSDGGEARPEASVQLRGAENVARQLFEFHHPVAKAQPALVNGAAGVVIHLGERPIAVIGFTVARGRIVEIDAVADPDRLRRLNLSGFHDPNPA